MFRLSTIAKPFPIGVQAPPPPPPPPSGWAKEARLAVPAQTVQLEGFGLWLDETAAELKQTAGGGVLTSATADDVRFERVSDGTALAWDLVHYDAATGRLVGFVRLGTLTANRRFDFRMLAGKSGATEQNMAGAWADTVAAWFGASGTNRQGDTGRNLTASGVTADGTDPWVGIYDGSTSRMTHADGSFLNGLTALSIEAFVKADVTGSDRRLIDQGPNDTGNRTHGLMFRHDAEGLRAGAPNVWTLNLRVHDGTEYWSVRYESAANVQTTAWQHVLLSWKSGELPKLWIDGVLDTPTWSGRVRESDGSTEPSAVVSGTIQMPTGQFAIGGLGVAPMWQGRVAFVIIRPTAASSTASLLYARNRTEPRRVYGISQFVNGSPSNIPVVALPVEGSQDQSTTVTYDVAPRAYDPEDPVSLTAAGSVWGTITGAVVNSGKLDVTAGASAGDGTAAFTVSAGTTSSSSKVYVSVIGGSSGGGGSEYPSALRTVNVSNGSELAAALASAQPGDHIVLADGTYTNGSDFATSIDGTAANPIVIRAANKLLARLTRRINFAHAYYYLWGIDIDGVGLGVDPGADNLVVRRCRVRNYSSYQGIWCRVKATGCRFEYCDLSLPNSRGVVLDLGAGGRNLTVERCYFHDWGPSGTGDQTFEPVQIGFGVADTDIVSGFVIRRCLFENINQGNAERETISIKSSGALIEQCHLKDARMIMIRHGESNRIEGCRLENISGTKPTRIQVFDELNKVLTSVAPDIHLSAGDVGHDGMTASGQHPAAANCKVISCNAALTVGAQESSSYTVPASNNSVEDHTGSVTLLNETGTTQTGTPSETGLSTITLMTADVGPDAP